MSDTAAWTNKAIICDALSNLMAWKTSSAT